MMASQIVLPSGAGDASGHEARVGIVGRTVDRSRGFVPPSVRG